MSKLFRDKEKTTRVTSWLIRFASLLAFVVSLSPALLYAQPATPTPTPKKVKKQFGSYREETVDMEVKVSGGYIRIYRNWQGDKKKWSINPQHDQIDMTDDPAAGLSSYGRLFKEEMSRGLRIMNHLGGGVYGVASAGSGAGGTNSPSSQAYTPSQGLMIQMGQLGITSCTNSGNKLSEVIIENSAGYKWVSKIGHKWAQYTESGVLGEWGKGERRIGKALFSTGTEVIRGYADTNDLQVLTYTRDNEGRIRFIRDYANREVEYVYNGNGELSRVVDVEGNETRYFYENGNIKRKVVGDDTGVPLEEAEGEQVTYTFDYYPSGVLRSVVDDNNEGRGFEYEYRPQRKVFVKTEQETGGREVITTTHVEHGIESVEVNGDLHLRVIRLCEDSVIIDKHNRETYFDRDGIGRLLTVRFPNGTHMSFDHTNVDWPQVGEVWGGVGRPWGVKTMRTVNGTEVDYERNENGDITQATETSPGSGVRIWKRAYNTNWELTEQRVLADPAANDPLKDWINYWSWDAMGRVETYKDAANNTWRFESNAVGDVTKITAPNTGVTDLDYVASGKLSHITTPSGYDVFFTYNKRGLVKRKREVYASGQEAITRYIYNRRGRVKKIVDPFGNNWTYTYNGAGQLQTATDAEGKTRSWTYYRNGRLRTITDEANVTITVDYFDTHLPGGLPQLQIPFGPIVKITYPSYVEELRYDLADRLVARILKPNSGASQTTQYEYDEGGRVTKITYPDAKEVLYEYDQLNRVTSVTAPGWGTSTVLHDDKERKITYTDPLGNTIEQVYNQLGQVVSEKRADLTTIAFTYDVMGNVQSYLSSLNKLHWFSHDLSSRTTQVDIYPGPTNTGTPVNTTTYDYNFRGDVTGYADSATSTTFGLDKIGRLLNSSTNYGPFSKSHAYTYLKNGLRNTYTASEGTQYQYLWDNGNRFQGVTIPGEGSIMYDYTASDWLQPNWVQFPGGAKQDFEYDDLRRIERITSTDPASNPLFDYRYHYKTNTDLIERRQSAEGDYLYDYDDGDRLRTVTNPVGPGESYAYDDFGNRYPSTNPTSWVYDKNGAVTQAGGITYTYDDQGNRTQKVDGATTTKYIYDESDRLTGVESPVGTAVASYGYDSNGTRLWKDVGGVKTYFYYTDNGLSEEYDASGALVRSYLYEPDAFFGTAPLALKDTQAYHYIHTDHLGTPQKLHTRNGAVTWGAKFSPFGQASISPGSIENPIRLPGQYFDSETGLHQNFMRDYDPTLGAYLEQDPYGILTGPNRYGYAYGDPMSFTDPTGEFAVVGVILVTVLLDQIMTGFPAVKCALYLWDRCQYSGYGQYCWDDPVDALLSIGTLGVEVGLTYVGFGWVGKYGDDAFRLLGKIPKRFKSEFGGIRIPSPKQIRKLLGVSKEGFHDTKKHILKQLGKKQRRLAGTNPDIGVDDLGNIVLRNRDNGRTVVTDIPLESFVF
ncbi:RHS domain-containing protein [Oligoflexia bacterium]|nr:RHS domain-containing protein [Oligoflexia bacterium]